MKHLEVKWDIAIPGLLLIEPVLKDYKMLDNMKVVNPYKDGRLPILEALGKITKN